MEIKTVVPVILVLGGLVLGCSQVFAQDTNYARDLYNHKLKAKATETFIKILHNPTSSSNEKAEALYYLGQISFEEDNYSVAMEDWQKLIKQYPDSSQAKEIKERLVQLREVTTKISDATITSVVARSYINNGDFWSEADRKFTIDSSWLPNVELAIEWYDRVIKEFPQSSAAEIAYERKLFTLFGWEEIGRYGTSYGLKENFDKYMPQILQTFEEFEKSFPSSSSLQGFRYQIAQAYWGKKDFGNAKKWLQKIIEAGGEQETFYTKTAKARIQKLEW